MSTLYRNYRPEKFKDILGQNHIKVSLQNEVANNNLSQAYLFAGPRAVGKTTLARVLAKAVNCLNRKKNDHEPCGNCQSCLSIKEGKNFEVVEIDAASNTGVDNVRDNIINFARLNPSQANFKVFIIDEVHMLSISAFNALLKILEEPPLYVIFILCTTELHKVPKTIVSRCQHFNFKKITTDEIIRKLKMITEQEKISVDELVLVTIAKESGGHLRDAESLLGQILALGEKKIDINQAELILPKNRSSEAIDFLSYLFKKDSAKALDLVNKLIEEGVDLKNFIQEVIFILRKLLLNLAQPGLAEKLGLDLGQELELKTIDLSSKIKTEKALSIMKRILIAYNEKNNLLAQLPLEMAIIEICSLIENKEINFTKSKNEQSKVINEETIKSKETDKEESGELIVKMANISCQKVKELWPEFLIKIKKYNHSLSFILQNCSPGNLESGYLNLQFKYKFHYDRALDSSVRPIIEKTLADVFKVKVKIKAILNEDLEIEEKKEKNIEDKDSTANNLLKSFGGQIIS